MAYLAGQFSWSGTGSLRLLLPLLATIFFVVTLLFYLNKKLLTVILTAFFFASAASSVYNAFFSDPLNSEFAPKQGEYSEIHFLAEGKEMKHKPDIFLLTYDAYVENETMLQYGIDNSEQEKFLEDNGFIIYRGTYSIGAATISTMDRVLDVSLKPAYSRKGVSGDGAVQNILKERGYKTLGIFKSDYMFRGVGAKCDEFFPEKRISFSLLINAVLEGEFRFDAGFENVSYSEFLSKKLEMLTANKETPVFMYTHTGPSHSQNSGKCLPDETELFEERLKQANLEMREDIASVLKRGRDSVIIVNGDHGPYLTKNCTGLGKYHIDDINRLDIQDRFGTFLAIRWPQQIGAPDRSKIRILQDIYPAIFSKLFEDDVFLQSRLPRIIISPRTIAGAFVKDGVIEGGIDDGKPLFESMVTDR